MLCSMPVQVARVGHRIDNSHTQHSTVLAQMSSVYSMLCIHPIQQRLALEA